MDGWDLRCCLVGCYIWSVVDDGISGGNDENGAERWDHN